MFSIRRAFALAAAAAAPLSAGAQVPQPYLEGGAARAMTVVDLIEVPSLSDPRLSPDGRQVVFTRSDADWEANETVSHIWRVDADGGGLVRLTRGSEGQRSPRWSPDGRWIAFLAEREDEEATQIHLLPVDGGEAHPLTDHASSVSDPQWSPDGRWVYFLAAEPESEEAKRKEEAEDDVFAYDEDYRHRHLWRVDAATGEETRVTGGDWSVTDYNLSRDGTRVAHHRAPTPLIDDADEAEVWVMDADGGDARRLTHNAVPESGAELSPDNRRVLFTAFADGDFEFYHNDNVFVAPVGGGAARDLTADEGFEVGSATWSADGRAVYVVANTGVRRDLFRIDAESGAVERLTRGDHAIGSWSYAPELDRHVMTIASSADPGEVYALGAGDAAPRRVTGVFEGIADRFLLPRQQAVTWRGEDGVEVEGLLFHPLGWQEGRRYPLVVQTHGGPASSDKFGFGGSHDYVQKLTAMGYMVLQPNYRGSTGYGDAFLRDMVPGYFNQAHKDVMAGVDALIERGLVDGERMAKMGWSAGGHMTNKIITYTDRFRAAASGAGSANWVSMYAQSDVRTYRTPWFGGTPWEKNAPIEAFIRDSPLFEAHEVTTPTIFLVGQNDPRVPMPQSVEMYRALEYNEVPTHLYVAPREGHGWRELRHRLFKANVELDWFERWVRGREYAWEVAPPERKVAERGVTPN